MPLKTSWCLRKSLVNPNNITKVVKTILISLSRTESIAPTVHTGYPLSLLTCGSCMLYGGVLHWLHALKANLSIKTGWSVNVTRLFSKWLMVCVVVKRSAEDRAVGFVEAGRWERLLVGREVLHEGRYRLRQARWATCLKACLTPNEPHTGNFYPRV